MREFKVPSQLFRWFLKNASTDNETYSYEVCFPRYLAAGNREGYLWRSYDRRLQMLIDIVRNGKGKSSPLRVLEVGCGFGHDLLWTALAGAQAVGIDVKSEFVEIARLSRAHIERHIGNSIAVDIRRTNLMEMSGEVFDLIYMKDVFHHLEPRDAIVAKLASLMAPGARILIVEPNAWNPLIQLQMFRIRGFNTIVEKTDAATGERFLYGNERLVAGGYLRRCFLRVGVHGTSRYIRFLPTKLSGNRWMAFVAQGLEQLGLESLLRPVCIHSIFSGCKVGQGG